MDTKKIIKDSYPSSEKYIFRGNYFPYKWGCEK